VSGASCSFLNQKDRREAVSPEDNPDTSKVCGVIYRNAYPPALGFKEVVMKIRFTMLAAAALTCCWFGASEAQAAMGLRCSDWLNEQNVTS
jgi:hypothetical protein